MYIYGVGHWRLPESDVDDGAQTGENIETGDSFSANQVMESTIRSDGEFKGLQSLKGRNRKR